MKEEKIRLLDRSLWDKQELLEKMQDHKIIPRVKHDLSTQEGFMDAWEEAMVESMVSGASFGGAMSGAGTNAQINATGMAGIDPVLGNKKIKMSKSSLGENSLHTILEPYEVVDRPMLFSVFRLSARGVAPKVPS